MPNFVIVRHTVAYFPHWKAVFDKNQKSANEYGLKALYVLRDIDNKNDTTIILSAESLEKAKKFMSSSQLKDAMKMAGVIPHPSITYLSDATVDQ